VSEQRLLSPKIGLRWWWRCRTLLGKTPINLGFSHRRPFIGGRAMLEVDQGTHTIRWHGLGGRHPMVWPLPSPPPALLRTSSRVEKIGGSGFVSSNSENISCVTFLKHKNNRKQGIGTVASH
jgi:hypothetical protein